jgi:hypothetical protein
MEGDSKERLTPMLKGLLIWNNKLETAESITRKEWHELTLNEVNDILDSWIALMEKRMSDIYQGNHSNLLSLKFNDMMNNQENTMKQLADFSGMNINSSTISLYSDYLKKQPTMSNVYNLIGHHE